MPSSRPSAPAYRGVLLDIDGTLLDSNDAHALAWRDALAEYGVRASAGDLHDLIGMGGDKLLPRYGVVKGSARGRALDARKKAIFAERYLPKLRPLPGARELLERMKSAKLARVAATSAGEDELSALLDRAGVADLIPIATTSSDVAKSKPDPDIVEAAVARAGLPKRELLMIGDTPYDIEAARKAGVHVIAFRSGGWTDAQLWGAMRVYQGPLDLLSRWDGSPLAA